MADEKSVERRKRAAAARAVAEVQSNMVLGLGTGSTAAFVLELLGEQLREGRLRGIVGIPTSEATARQARALSIPLTSLAEHPTVDLAIDGADEVDPVLNLIKGLGGALLREKAVEQRARRFIVTVDDRKLVPKLGTIAPLPVEVGADDWPTVHEELTRLGGAPTRRGGDTPFVSDNGNWILDCRFGSGIEDPAGLARALDTLPGVLAHGLFMGMASAVVVAGPDGVRVLQRSGVD